jgi:cold shock CspA family protein
MPEPAQTTAKADEPELDCGTVLFWNGRFGWACVDGGDRDVYLGAPELARAGIARLEIGLRLCFEIRKSTHGQKPWAAKIRLEATA